MTTPTPPFMASDSNTITTSPVIDNLIALRILYLLVTPFKDMPAYRMGIIDEKGNVLKKYSQMSNVERSAYTYLHRLIFRLKRIIEKVPVENKKFLSYAAAFALIREHYNKPEPLSQDFELRLITEDVEVTTKDVEFIEENLEKIKSNKYLKSFRMFSEEGMTAAAVPANNIATTPGIDVPSPPVLGFKRVIRRKKNGNPR